MDLTAEQARVAYLDAEADRNEASIGAAWAAEQEAAAAWDAYQAAIAAEQELELDEPEPELEAG